MGTHAFSPQRAESFRHFLPHGAPGSRRFLTLTWVSRYRRGSQVTAQKSGGNLGHRAIQTSYWNVPSVPNLRLRIKSQIQRLPLPCPCVLCKDRAGNLTWHPQLMEIKIPALSQRRDKSGAPSRIKMRKGWASPPQSNFGPQRLRKESSFALQPLKGRLISKDLRHH